MDFARPAAAMVLALVNSFGIMDGGLDAAIRDALWFAVQQQIQRAIVERHHGELPVGCAELVETGDGRWPNLIVGADDARPENVARTLKREPRRRRCAARRARAGAARITRVLRPRHRHRGSRSRLRADADGARPRDRPGAVVDSVAGDRDHLAGEVAPVVRYAKRGEGTRDGSAHAAPSGACARGCRRRPRKRRGPRDEPVELLSQVEVLAVAHGVEQNPARPESVTDTSDDRRSVGSAVRAIKPASSRWARQGCGSGRPLDALARYVSSEGVSGPWQSIVPQRGALCRGEVPPRPAAASAARAARAPGAGGGRDPWWR